MHRPLSLFLALALPLTAATTLPTGETAILPTIEEGPAKPALEAFQSGKHEEAVAAATPLAKDGNPEALFLLGFAAETGQGLEPSRDSALDYYQKAATAGHQEATYRRALILLNSEDDADRQLGRMSLEKAAETEPAIAGRILGEAWLRGLLSEKPDPDKSITWWSKAADAGDTNATILLARLRSGDFGLPEKTDPALALKLYQQAAELEDLRAYLPLGSRLLNGEEKLRDETKGRKWLAKAIDQDQVDAYLALGDFEQNIKKDDKAAFADYLKGAEEGQVECMFRSAAFLINGRGTDVSKPKGQQWLAKASEAGHATAAFELASILSQKKAPDTAAVYTQLLLAAKGGLTQAQNELGLFYLAGSLGTSDPAAAISWFTAAAKAGFPAAQHNLATLYENGVGTPVDYKNAGQLYSLAANQNHGEATTALARMHGLGRGTDKDLPKAWALATLAKERGDDKAQEWIDQLDEILTPEMKTEATKTLEKLKQPPVEEKDKKKEGSPK